VTVKVPRWYSCHFVGTVAAYSTTYSALVAYKCSNNKVFPLTSHTDQRVYITRSIQLVRSRL